MARAPQNIRFKQISLVHVLKNKLGWSDAHYRDVLFHRYNATSCTELNQLKTRDLIDFMRQELGEVTQPKAPAATAATTPQRLTKEQRMYIVNLWWSVCRGQTTPEKSNGLRNFVFRQTGCDDLRFVPRSQAPALICAIKAMRHQKGGKNA